MRMNLAATGVKVTVVVVPEPVPSATGSLHCWPSEET
jgi:hypothetical protein